MQRNGERRSGPPTRALRQRAAAAVAGGSPGHAADSMPWRWRARRAALAHGQLRRAHGQAAGIIMLIISCAACGNLGAADAASIASKRASTVLGAPGFLPTPEHPVGWRGDWSGRFPGATP